MFRRGFIFQPHFFSLTGNTWVDSGLSITVPKGVYKVRYNLTGSVTNGSDTTLQMNSRLLNVNTGAPVDDSQRFLATANYVVGVTAPYSGSAAFDTLLYLDAPTTFRVEIINQYVAGSPVVFYSMSLEASCFIEYEEA